MRTNGGYTLPIVDEHTECALDIPGNVCSTSLVVDIIHKYIVKDKKIGRPCDIIEVAKEKTQCPTEECVVKKVTDNVENNEERKKIREDLKRFKPPGPATSLRLLNNENIDEVLDRLTMLNPTFYHMNFQMIDFAGVKDISGNWQMYKGVQHTPTELGELDMCRDVIDKKYNMFGVVLNTDVRTGGGIHWFALFCDFRCSPHTIEYFNSSGKKPVWQVQEWMIKTEKNLSANGKKCVSLPLSGIVHQKDSDSECGLYSLYFIWNRINDVKAENFQKKRIPDRMMTEFRKMCFK
jgi:hypothetical protein